MSGRNILYTRKLDKLPFIEEVMKLINTRSSTYWYQLKKYIIIINSEEKKLLGGCVTLHLFFLSCAFRLPAMTIVQQRSNGCNQQGWNEDLVTQLSKLIYKVHWSLMSKFYKRKKKQAGFQTKNFLPSMSTGVQFCSHSPRN